MALTAPTVSGYSPFWQLLGDELPYAMSQAQGRSKFAWRSAKLFNRYGTRDARAAIAVLIGAVAGTTATNTYSTVKGAFGPSQTVPVASAITDLGGLRTIETINAINRATSSADVTELKRWFNNTLLEAGITYPTRLGPGGGGKLAGGMSGFL
jgi:hypothetical protein